VGEARRVTSEIEKFFQDEQKETDMLFYKKLAECNLSLTQIEAMKASYTIR